MKWPARSGLRWMLALGLSLGGLAVFESMVWLVTGLLPHQTNVGRALLGAWGLTWIFLLGLGLLKLILRLSWAPLAVARTVLDEAVRMKLAVGFVAALLLLLVFLPALQDAQTPLRYRVQTFLSFALGATGVLLSLLTVFLACATLSHEVADQRIFTVLSKPVGRGAYLAGKWLGIAALNALLLAVAGIATYGFAWMLCRQPGTRSADVEEVQREVLTARVSYLPHPPEPLEARAHRRLDEMKHENAPELKEHSAEKLFAQLVEQEKRRWFSIDPHGRESYLFEDLRLGELRAEEWQLRWRLMSGRPDGEERLQFKVMLNGRTFPVSEQTGSYKLYRLPAQLAGTAGRLEVTVIHEHPTDRAKTSSNSLVLAGENGLELLGDTGGFGANLARALLVQWVRLGFLAMVGLTAATCLGFPVASLVALVVLAVALSSGFVVESMAYYGENAADKGLEHVTSPLRGMALFMATRLAEYGRFAANDLVVDGRLVPWRDVLACAGWVGLLWTGLAALLSWVVFRRRELGRVQV